MEGLNRGRKLSRKLHNDTLYVKDLLMEIVMTQYHSKPVSEGGIVNWSSEENSVWHDLVERQLVLVEQRACKEYLAGLELLNLPLDRAPQIVDINKVLKETTGWQIEPVPALINFDR